MSAEEDFFDAAFLGELEELARGGGAGGEVAALSEALRRRLERFSGGLGEEAFGELHAAELTDRVNALIEDSRGSPRREAAQAVESFAVFFRTLLPSLPEGAGELKRLFFRLAPTLLHIAFEDFGPSPESPREGREALRALESVLTEISHIRLAPSESELVFRSIDQMAGFIAVGEYSMARDLISTQLLGIIARNRLTRALYRIMEVEVSLQRYLKQRLGYATPQIRVPEDIDALGDYAPIRVFEEEDATGERRMLIQLHLPDVSELRDVVLHAVERDSGRSFDLRLDALGSTELALPPGTYSLGLVYEPEA